MVEVGDKAPDFNLKDQDGNDVKLSDYNGKKVLLAFYPFAFSPTCTQECTLFQQDLERFSHIQILGISVDSHFTQKAFANQMNLGFPLLSDFNKEASKAYGILREEGFSERAYFTIDENGTIVFKKVMETPKEKMNNDDLIEETKK